MKKFAVVIFSVSMFFFALGGIARPFLDRFKSEKHTISFTSQSSEEISEAHEIHEIPEENKIREVKTLNFVSKDGQNILIRVPESNTVIEQKIQSAEKHEFEFERLSNPEKVPHPEGLPRVSGKSVVIIKRTN